MANIGAVTRLKRVGGSIMMTVPPALLEQVSLEEGSEVEITVRYGALEVKPTQPYYTLDQLLAASDYSQDVRDDEWLDTPPAGREQL